MAGSLRTENWNQLLLFKQTPAVEWRKIAKIKLTETGSRQESNI